MRYLLRLVAVLGYGLRISGQTRIPRDGAVLIVSNHQSHLDPPLVGICCRRRLNFMARETLFAFKPFGWLIRSLDAFPIDREGTGLAGVKETLRRLKRGEMVLVFPEGTRTRDGEIAPFRPGFATLAVRGRAAIQPVAIEGAFDAWPRWNRFPGPGRIHIHFGCPLKPEEIEHLDERDLIAEAECRVRACQAVLRGGKIDYERLHPTSPLLNNTPEVE